MIFSKKPLWLVKFLHYEYWPWWMMYTLMFPWFLWQSSRAKSITFFSNVNPFLPFGGFINESKIAFLEQFDPIYIPKTLLIERNCHFKDIQEKVDFYQLQFPLICKPDVGHRGNNVEKIENLECLKKYSEHNFDFIIQEFIDFPLEFGLLYYRMPGQINGQITSLTGKKFMSVTGDGYNSIQTLMGKTVRTRFQIKAYKNKFGKKIDEIIEKDKKLLLEPIGNHCRGTEFIDNNFLINQELENVFDHIAKPLNDFHYGRFDLKVTSIADLYNGKNIKIVELNGINADPAHIFDANFKFINAIKVIAKHWKILAEISIIQQKKGIKPTSVKQILRGAFSDLLRKK